ncbi:MAG TPA: PDZ domain-containing protein [Candidatus Angelobacter sp.]|nr:PDZ domain-containing protein [Candidatus Angelobacter sp.]
MTRTFITVLILGSLAFAAPKNTLAAQPGAQPQPQPDSGLNPLPPGHFYASDRSYLGVDIRDITTDRMAALKLKDERGVEITAVDQDAPAGKAGLREHDVILTFNGTNVVSEEQLRRLIRETPPGRTVRLGISRDGAPLSVSVQLADHNKFFGGNRVIVIPPVPQVEFPQMANRFDFPNNIYVLSNTSAVLGVQAENLTSQLGDFFGVRNGEGVLVRSVEKGSPADKGGLKAGDVIVRIGSEKLSDRSDLVRLLHKHRSGGKLDLGVVRDKREQSFTVDLPKRQANDSSSLYFDSDQLASLGSELNALEPQLDSAAREMARANVRAELDKAMQTYKKSMRQYKDQFKELQKQLEKQQKEFNREFSPML